MKIGIRTKSHGFETFVFEYNSELIKVLTKTWIRKDFDGIAFPTGTGFAYYKKEDIESWGLTFEDSEQERQGETLTAVD